MTNCRLYTVDRDGNKTASIFRFRTLTDAVKHCESHHWKFGKDGTFAIYDEVEEEFLTESDFI